VSRKRWSEKPFKDYSRSQSHQSVDMYHSFHSLQNVLAGLGASVNALQAQQAHVLRELKDTESSVASFIGSQQQQQQQQQQPLLQQQPSCSGDDVRKIVREEVDRADGATRGWLKEQVAAIVSEVDQKIAALNVAPDEAPPEDVADASSLADQPAEPEAPEVHETPRELATDETPVVIVEESSSNSNIKGRKGGGGGRGRGKKITI
jgi:hypothetical protein